ncbi:PST family polysaccharide transporter [Nocardioides sp. BE266]|uniref:oligosaccharide flippase family protein n=1 Tax=Nocardioides sp. BE266 TaxID=2817725 RepID=UPI002862B079|nr:oligosaccharide flippase family protein [Nocardioides sp. BE266]MDR7252407.1 PST family polysaccharide transporter [Nocardioides sp. BE266]
MDDAGGSVGTGTTGADGGQGAGLARAAAGAFGWSFLNTALSRFGTLLVGVLLARILGPSEFGTFAVALVALLAVLSFNELGVSLAVVRWERDPRTMLGSVNVISTAGSVMLFAGLCATAGPIARVLGAPDAAGIIRLMSVSVVFSGMVAGPAALLQRQFRQRRRFVIDQFVTWSGTALSLGLALGGFGAWSLAWGRVLATLVGVVLFVHATRPYRWQVDRTLVRPLLRFGLPLAGASIVVFAVGYVEQVAVAATLGATSLGFFVLAFNLASWPLNMFSQPLRSVAPAVFSRMQDDPRRVADAFTLLLRVLAAVTLPVCLVGAAVSDDVVRFVYGDEWARAADVFAILVLATSVRIFLELSYDLLVVMRRTGGLLTVQLLWLAVLGPAVWFAARQQGLVGVAVAELAVVLVVVLPCYLAMLRGTGIPLAPLGAAVVLPLLVAAAAAGLTWLVTAELASPFMTSLAAGIICLAAIACVLLLRPDLLRQAKALRSGPAPAPLEEVDA